jgi:type IV secretion system protein VirD4
VSILCRLLLLAATGLFAFGLVRLGILYPPGVCLAAAAFAWKRMRSSRNSGSHGTAYWATASDLDAGGMLAEGSKSLVLGTTEYLPRPAPAAGLQALLSPRLASGRACRLFLSSCYGNRWSRENLIRIDRFAHLMTVAPTRRGKGVSVVVPNLLSYQGSTCIVDLKGELAALTAEHRRRAFGHRCIVINPFRLPGLGGETINPLDFIDAHSPEFLDSCRLLANAMVVRSGKEDDPHWPDSAEFMITAVIAYVCALETDPRERNLNLVKETLSSRKNLADAAVRMQQSRGFDGVLSRLGHTMTWFIDRELGSVMTTSNRFLNFIDSPLVAASLASSSFDPIELRGKASLYLVLPQTALQTHGGLLRLWLATILRRLTAGLPDEQHPVLFMLDEAGHYAGQMQILEDATTIMTGYGIRLWYVFQSLGQIRECYGDKASKLLDNIDTQQYFGINSFESCKGLSEMLGETTLIVASEQDGTSTSYQTGLGQPRSENWSRSRSTTLSEVGRFLLKPDEVRRLPEDVSLVIQRNLPPIACKLLRYYDHPAFRQGRTGFTGVGFKALLAACVLLASAAAVAAFTTNLEFPVARPRPRIMADRPGGTFTPPYPSAETFFPPPPQRRALPLWQPPRPHFHPEWRRPAYPPRRRQPGF